MLIEEYKSLKSYNTFGIECSARYFVSVKSVDTLKQALSLDIHKTILLLGGGSNMLLTQDVDALVIHLDLKGLEILSENEEAVELKVMGGENWHELVTYCVEKNWGGIENLSLIPGNVGTAPIQNIGAYGVELKDVFVCCEALNIEKKQLVSFSKSDCEFGYRNSIFKNREKGNYAIVSITLRLTKENHVLKTDYGAIRERLASKNIYDPTIKDISEAVIEIRQSKLPDPKILGNSGSFFKNPVVDNEAFKSFHSKFPDAPYYEMEGDRFKIPAGWLIEKAGFKGKRYGDAGVHTNQALVLVNHENASGEEIWNLAMKIQTKVRELFDITIIPEVNII